MSKQNSWFKLSQFKPGCNPEAMFGCSEFKAETDWLYPDRKLKLNSTIIWIPSKKIHIGVASYVDAFRNNDAEAISKLSELGIPAGLERPVFSVGPGDDVSCTYETVGSGKKRGRKPGSGPVTKVMRAEYSAMYEDGEKFEKGTVVKILFRKKFVRNADGAKKFQNVYVRPSAEEIADFIKTEKKGLAFPA